MINWFEKIKNSDYIFINNIINDNKFSYNNSILDIINKNNEDNIYIIISYSKIDINNNNIYVTNNYNKIISLVKNIKKQIIFILNIDYDFLSNIDNFAKLIIKISKRININNFLFSIVINENLDTHDNTIYNICNIYHLISSLKCKSKKQTYEYVYDICCDYLDYIFKKNHYCDFKNDKCIANREKLTCHIDNGCCYYIVFNKLISFKNKGVCPYQKDKHCEIKCLPCKLFTCKYYRKQGIKFTTQNVFLLKHLFNKKQKLILKYNIYRNKDMIINKLLEKNYMPYLIYYLSWSYYIKNPKL